MRLNLRSADYFFISVNEFYKIAILALDSYFIDTIWVLRYTISLFLKFIIDLSSDIYLKSTSLKFCCSLYEVMRWSISILDSALIILSIKYILTEGFNLNPIIFFSFFNVRIDLFVGKGDSLRKHRLKLTLLRRSLGWKRPRIYY